MGPLIKTAGTGKKIWFFFALFLLVFLAREIDYVRRSSQTYDEHFYIAYGSALYHKWDFRLRKDKTSLIPLLSAAPLLFTKAEFPENDPNWLKSDTRELPKTGHWNTAPDIMKYVWQFALDFLYKNTVPPDTILLLARLPVVLLSLVLAFFVFIWTRGLYGDIPALIALGLYTNCPNILANSGLVTEDLGVSLFIFCAVYFYRKYYGTGVWRNLVFSGISMGLALNTKYTAVILLPAMVCFSVFEALVSGKKNLAALVKPPAIAALSAAAVLLAFYRITDIGEYVTGFRFAADAIQLGQMTFLAGAYSPTGFWNYFLYAFFIKTPLPVILTLGLALFLGDRGAKGILKYRELLYLILVPAALFVPASFSPLQIGFRHILPIYPFLFVLCAGAYNAVKGGFRWVLAALGLWYLGSSAVLHPHYLSYFNEMAGGPAGGYEYMLDSNLDWGQDLNKLKIYLKEENASDVVLSYFGSSVPEYFGRDFQDLFSFGVWGEKKHVNSLSPAKELLAISVTNLQGLYLSKIGINTFFWLKERRPRIVIGNTIHVYDITRDAAAHKRLASIYLISGDGAKTVHECKRVLKLEPGSPAAAFILALNDLSEEGTEAAGIKAMAGLFSDALKRGRAVDEAATLADTAYARKFYSERLAYMGTKMMAGAAAEPAARLLELAVTLDGSNESAYINLGSLYIRSGRYEPALKLFSAAEKTGSQRAEIFYGKALALYHLKDAGNSRTYARKALAVSPDMPQAKHLLSLIR